MNDVNGLEIVDAHVHFWDIENNYLPWLRDRPIEFRYGDYQAIRKNYLPPDYFADAAPHRVRGTVYVETEWDPRDPIGETRWVQGLKQRYGVPSVMVAQAWLDAADAAEVVAAQAAFPFVRGIRHKPPSASAMSDSRWRAGFALLERHRLSFDLQAPYEWFDAAAALAREFPATSVIVNHTGLPADRSARGIDAWKRAMRTLSACPNIHVKISGLGRGGLPWRVEDNRPIVLETIETFGVERCMFASNFPVDKLVATYDAVISGFAEIVHALSSREQRKLFVDNAITIYRL